MYDTGKVIVGLAVFVVVFTYPFWWGVVSSEELPELPTPEGACVESSEFMRASHMDLLNDWRDAVVRDGLRVYTSGNDGAKHEMSLSNTCLDCHDDKVAFCDECHDYASVAPKCWECHVDPTAEVK